MSVVLILLYNYKYLPTCYKVIKYSVFVKWYGTLHSNGGDFCSTTLENLHDSHICSCIETMMVS